MNLYFNGVIDSLKTQATAMAVEGKKILAIGTDAEILNLDNPSCRKFNLNKKTVWPGLTDSHLHFDMYSQSLTQVKCETNTIDECLNLVREKVKHTHLGEWITGQGWNQNTWGGFGNVSQLDLASGQYPVFLADKSIHAAWVNSTALKIAQIDKYTPDPEGGSIQKDKDGNPTGILFENAVNLVEKLIPPITSSQRLECMLKGQKSLHRLGLIGIHDFDRAECFSTLQEMNQSGTLTLRVTKSIPIHDLDHAISIGLRTGFGDPHLHMGSVKLFADGALGPQTAAMLTPYENTTDNFGTLLLKADEIFEIGMKATSQGWSLAIHAIGDKANNEVLNGLAMVRQFEIANGIPQRLHRIEHLQLIHPDDLQKAKDVAVIASMQPIHILSDMFTADKHWGKRSRKAYAFSSFLKSGIHLIFGSDAPVESPNPFVGISAAVTRRRENGDPGASGWYPEERISLAEAKKAYSETPAFVSERGNGFGQIKAGFAADFLILPDNPEILEPMELSQILPEQVFVDGNCVFEIG
jgi:predicted amidohydrolase YtcJ